MKKMVITGGKGDIAKALAKIFADDFKVFTPARGELNVEDASSIYLYLSKINPDIVINCAGYIEPTSIEDSIAVDWERKLSVNLLGSYRVSKEAIRDGCKCIINIGSSASTKGKAGWSGYCASKRGLVSLTESLHAEEIQCVCISPCRTDTKMRKKLFPDEDKTKLLTPKEFAIAVYNIYMQIAIYSGNEVHVKKSPKGLEYYLSKIELVKLDVI